MERKVYNISCYTTIAKNIRVAVEKARYDAACKRLLSEKIFWHGS